MGTYLAIFAIAAIVNLIGFIWLVIVGFQRSVVWGILVFLFSPLTAIIFAIMHWFVAKKAFLLYILSTIAMIVPLYLMVSSMGPEQLARIVQGIESGEIDPNTAFAPNAQQPSTGVDLQPGELPLAVEGSTMDQNAAADAAPAASQEQIMAMADSQEQPQADAVPTDKDSKTAATSTATKSKDDASRYPSLDKVVPDPLVVKQKPPESPTIRVKLENIAKYKGRYFIITTKDGIQHRGLLNKTDDSTLYLSRKLYGGDFEYRVAKKKVDYVDMLKEEYVKEFMEK